MQGQQRGRGDRVRVGWRPGATLSTGRGPKPSGEDRPRCAVFVQPVEGAHDAFKERLHKNYEKKKGSVIWRHKQQSNKYSSMKIPSFPPMSSQGATVWVQGYQTLPIKRTYSPPTALAKYWKDVSKGSLRSLSCVHCLLPPVATAGGRPGHSCPLTQSQVLRFLLRKPGAYKGWRWEYFFICAPLSSLIKPAITRINCLLVTLCKTIPFT